ncbi:MAG: RluA family pseudouridine synthase [Deltaproteobacteria bacterium]|nr:RluA family pseudouridine synthase [Deltaproteobacteria bacterium]
MTDEPPLAFIVQPDEGNVRLASFLRVRLPGVSSGAIKKVIEAGQVWVDSRPGRKGQRLRVGQRVLAATAPDERPLPSPEMPLEVIDVTPAVVVVNKPPGVPTHPLLPAEQGTLANALVARYPECIEASELPREGGLVHRLDTSTSGVLLAARSRRAFQHLRGLFRAGQVDKRYLALVSGAVEKTLVIERAIKSDGQDRRRVEVSYRDDVGLPSRSVVHPLARLGAWTLVHVDCHTGRRHQVRLHLASQGHPLAGDVLYGGEAMMGLEGALLHAAELSVEGRTFVAALPEPWRQLLAKLGWSQEDAGDGMED